MDVQAEVFYGIAFTSDESNQIGYSWESVSEELKYPGKGKPRITYHGSENYPRWYVTIADLGEKHVYSGNFLKIESWPPTDGADEQIRLFCEAQGYPFSPDRLGWYVASRISY